MSAPIPARRRKTMPHQGKTQLTIIFTASPDLLAEGDRISRATPVDAEYSLSRRRKSLAAVQSREKDRSCRISSISGAIDSHGAHPVSKHFGRTARHWKPLVHARSISQDQCFAHLPTFSPKTCALYLHSCYVVAERCPIRAQHRRNKRVPDLDRFCAVEFR